MKKKIVIGSLIVVVIFLLTLFIPAIGVQSPRLSDKKESPLFTMRINNAVEKQNNEPLVSNYIGKEKDTTFPFPKRDTRFDLMDYIIEKIRTMDDTEESMLVNLIKNELDNHFLDNEDIHHTLVELHESQPFSNIIPVIDNTPVPSYAVSCGVWAPSVCQWAPGCYLIQIIAAILIAIFEHFTIFICG